jgi:hypothetical protein
MATTKAFPSTATSAKVLVDVRCPLPPEILGAPLLSSRVAKKYEYKM